MTKRVLIADDDPIVVHLISELIAKLGYVPVSAANAPRAMTMLDHERVDLLITDIYMPGNESLELLRHARAKQPNLPIIVMTGEPELRTAVEALRLNACDYLVKPLDPRALRIRVESAIGQVEQQERIAEAIGVLRDALTADSNESPLATRGADHPLSALSEREREVALAFSKSPVIGDVATTLNISVHTVRNHFRAIYRKLNIRSQAELIVRLREADE